MALGAAKLAGGLLFRPCGPVIKCGLQALSRTA
jgi:hypothetical protein